MIEVILVYRPNCPWCRKVMEIAKEVCSQLGIPYRLEDVDSYSSYLSTSVFKRDTKVLDLEKLVEIGEVNVEELSRATPILIIRFYSPRGDKLNYVVFGGVLPGKEEEFTKIFFKIMHSLVVSIKDVFLRTYKIV